MFKFLFMMFFMFILLVFLMGFSILRTIKNVLFGSGSKEQKNGQRRKTSRKPTSEQQRSRNEDTASQKKKIFTQEEGEYVDYEEVK
ncbi:MAG: DUF4834 family protein [Tannerellaceae bacterium]|nr:DUF4834 family protein [Tannerellaceae bacterium]